MRDEDTTEGLMRLDWRRRSSGWPNERERSPSRRLLTGHGPIRPASHCGRVREPRGLRAFYDKL